MSTALRFATPLLFSLGIAPAGAAGIEGSQVSATVYCCTAPVESDRLSATVVRTVGPGVEFPAGSFPLVNPGMSIIGSDIDFSAAAIDFTYVSSATSSNGSFNGFVFDFAGLQGVAIAGVGVNPLSSFAPAQLAVGHDADTITLSLPGLAFSSGTKVVLDLAFTPAVPEPSAWALFAAGFAWVGMAARRRVRRR